MGSIFLSDRSAEGRPARWRLYSGHSGRANSLLGSCCSGTRPSPLVNEIGNPRYSSLGQPSLRLGTQLFVKLQDHPGPVVLDKYSVNLRRLLGGHHESECIEALAPGFRLEDSPAEFPDHNPIVPPRLRSIEQSDEPDFNWGFSSGQARAPVNSPRRRRRIARPRPSRKRCSAGTCRRPGARLVRLPGDVTDVRAARHSGGARDPVPGGAVSGRFYRIPVSRFRWGLKRAVTAASRTACGCWNGRVAVSSAMSAGGGSGSETGLWTGGCSGGCRGTHPPRRASDGRAHRDRP